MQVVHINSHSYMWYVYMKIINKSFFPFTKVGSLMNKVQIFLKKKKKPTCIFFLF